MYIVHGKLYIGIEKWYVRTVYHLLTNSLDNITSFFDPLFKSHNIYTSQFSFLIVLPDLLAELGFYISIQLLKKPNFEFNIYLLMAYEFTAIKNY